ncbi:MAG: ATP-binding protein, partial [Gammaproteobacteria bacterium]
DPRAGEPGGPGGPARPGARGPGRPPFERHWVPTITMVAGALASLLFAGLLAWYFSRPIRALRDAFDAAAGGDLSPRFAKGGGVRADELTDLGRDFDRMSAQLRTLMDGQRRLLHDVSHELRSPLARLQAAIGLAHQRPDRIDASLERIERESVRMDKLVGELLTLSRLEAAPALPAQEDIALMDLVEEIAGDASFEAEQSGRTLAVSGMALVTVRGAPDLLWRAIENVVRNAIKHSPPGGTVTLRLEADAQQARIDVLDRGPGVAPADLAAIFQPFFRSEPTANNVDGHGLGLAIAQRVVLAHGGSIGAENRDGGGLRVTIALPVAQGSFTTAVK